MALHFLKSAKQVAKTCQEISHLNMSGEVYQYVMGVKLEVGKFITIGENTSLCVTCFGEQNKQLSSIGVHLFSWKRIKVANFCHPSDWNPIFPELLNSHSPALFSPFLYIVVHHFPEPLFLVHCTSLSNEVFSI